MGRVCTHARRRAPAVLIAALTVCLVLFGAALPALAASLSGETAGAGRVEARYTRPIGPETEPENHVEPPEPAHIAVEDGTAFISNEIVLMTDAAHTKADAAAVGGKYGFRLVGYIEAANTAQLRTDRDYSLPELNGLCDTIMAQEPETVRHAGANYIRRKEPLALPDDPWDGSELEIGRASGGNWGVEAINATWVWDNYPDIPCVRIGLIDTMFDASHEDIPYVKTLHNLIYYDSDKNKSRASHGTHVAGTIGAIHNNGKGVAGVLPNCEIIGASYFGAMEEPSSLDEVALLAEVLSYGVKIVNYSMGYSLEFQLSLQEGDPSSVRGYRSEIRATTQALLNLLDNGYDFLIVASAGNEGESGCEALYGSNFTGVTDPDAVAHILVVGAAELDNGHYCKAAYSNLGDRVDVMAPGTGIYSSVCRNGYYSYDGTSMAAPHVSGACGILQALHPELTCEQIKNIIVSTADIEVLAAEKPMINIRTALQSLDPSPAPIGGGVRSLDGSSADEAEGGLTGLPEPQEKDGSPVSGADGIGARLASAVQGG